MKKKATEKQLLENLGNCKFYRDYIIPENFITKHKDKVNWSFISSYQELSENLITKHKDKVSWAYISTYQTLSEDFITKHKDKVYWLAISVYQILSEKFITKHIDKIDWYRVSYSQKLSEKFIIKYKDLVDWPCVSYYQKLSEEFIEKYKDRVSWFFISKCQVLSEDFIKGHKERVDWLNISKYQKLSERFSKKHKLTISKDCWLYKDKTFKLEYLKKHTNYEIIEDKYILAYKTVKNNNCSVFALHKYKYETGQTYESNCDYNVNHDNSFGLAAWAKEKTLNYYSEGKLLLVKIMIDDIGAIVQENQKIRCRKLTVVKEI